MCHTDARASFLSRVARVCVSVKGRESEGEASETSSERGKRAKEERSTVDPRETDFLSFSFFHSRKHSHASGVARKRVSEKDGGSFGVSRCLDDGRSTDGDRLSLDSLSSRLSLSLLLL